MKKKYIIFARHLICAIICLLVIIGITHGYAYASTGELSEAKEDAPRNSVGISTGLYISSGVANASTRIVNYDNSIVGIVCIMSLQKFQNGSWVNVESWRKTSSGESIYLSASRGVSRGKYRVKSRVTVYKGNSVETMEVYSQTVTY
ncbi:MAG: hypothetical protein J5928_02050 [Firmicutes bacterium]|nr:hypothetical protein [Bacillota bacterium]